MGHRFWVPLQEKEQPRKKKRHQKGAAPEGNPSAQEEGDAAPAAAWAEDHRPEWEEDWEPKVVVESIKEITG